MDETKYVALPRKALDVIALVSVASMHDTRPTMRERKIGWQSSEFDSSEGICRMAREVLTTPTTHVAVKRELLEYAVWWVDSAPPPHRSTKLVEALRALLSQKGE